MTLRIDNNIINYAIEIYPNSNDTWVNNDTYGIKSDAIRLVTGNPGYIGSDNKSYSNNEIDISGNDISNAANNYKYYNLLTKDGLVGPDMSVNVEVTTNCNLDTSFEFSIRNDNGFYSYLNNNSIILNNRRCKFYTIINDIFYSCGFGEISSITQSEESINFSVEKSYKQLDKQIPPTYVTTELDEETGEYKEEVMPIVLGDVEHSMILKEEAKILPIKLDSDNYTCVPARIYEWNNPEHQEASYNPNTGYYPYIDLYTGGKVFAENDIEIMGAPINNTYPNSKYLYVKYGKDKPTGFFKIQKNDASINYSTTRIYLGENLTNNNDEILNPKNFNSSLSIDPLQYAKAVNNYATLWDLISGLGLSNGQRFYIGSDGYDTASGALAQAKGSQTKMYDIFSVTIPIIQPNIYSSCSLVSNTLLKRLSYGNVYNSDVFGGNEDSWWFQICDININCIVSTDATTCELQTTDNNIIADTYDDDYKAIKDDDGKVTDISFDNVKKYKSVSS